VILGTPSDMRTPRSVPIPTTPRAVLFDLDGTLIDTMGGFADVAAAVMASRFGLDLAEARARYLGTSGIPFRQQLEVIRPGDPGNQDASDEFEAKKRVVADTTDMDDETVAGLANLARLGLKLVVSSNSAQHFVDDFARRSGFHFDVVLGHDAARGLAKGEPHVAHVCRTLGLGTSDLVFCGDSLVDGDLANACGVAFVARLGTFTLADFRRRDPEAIAVARIPELATLLARAAA
jgi:phosphoglycolate phosphatase